MKIIYQSLNYNPDAITHRYLYIDRRFGKPVVIETVKTEETNYTYRSYELSEDEYPRYSKVIDRAQKIKGCFPCTVELTPNEMLI